MYTVYPRRSSESVNGNTPPQKVSYCYEVCESEEVVVESESVVGGYIQEYKGIIICELSSNSLNTYSHY